MNEHQASVKEKIEQILSEQEAERQAAYPDSIPMPDVNVWIVEHLADYFTESDPEMIWGDEVFDEKTFKLLVLNMYDFALYVTEANMHEVLTAVDTSDSWQEGDESGPPYGKD
jgi:hypothetical protein